MSTVFTFEIGLESKVGLAPILDRKLELKRGKNKVNLELLKKFPKKSLKITINIIE